MNITSPDDASTANTSPPSLIEDLQVTQTNFQVPLILQPLVPTSLELSHPHNILGGVKEGSVWSMSSLSKVGKGIFQLSPNLTQLIISKERLMMFLLARQEAGKVDTPIVAVVGQHKPSGTSKVSNLPIIIFAHWRDRCLEPNSSPTNSEADFSRHVTLDEDRHLVKLCSAGWHLFTSDHDTSPYDHAFPMNAKIVHPAQTW